MAGNVKTNDTLGDGTAVQHTITWGSEVGKYGTLTTGTDGSYSYSLHNDLAAVQQLAVGDSLTETFSYTLTDVDGQTSTATLTITITGTNDGPVGNATAVLPAGPEDLAYVVSASDLLKGFSDIDGDEILVSGLACDHGTVIDNGDGTFTIAPVANYNGPLGTDIQRRGRSWREHGGDAKLQATLTAVNDAPTGGVTISGTATEDQTLTASHTLADDDGLGTVSYTWIAAASTSSVTGDSYMLGQADVGKTFTVWRTTPMASARPKA